MIRATLWSALAAGAILVLVWLPAEYGIDATGMGRLMGLTEMGEIKQQLYSEARAQDAARNAETVAMPSGRATADPEVVARLSAIERQLAAIGAVMGVAPITPQPVAEDADPRRPADSATAPLRSVAASPDAEAQPPASAAPGWRDEIVYTLSPAEGIEVKLVMEEGAVAEFDWNAGGAVLNYDTHGEGDGQKTSYEQGRSVPGQEGALVAAFAGSHGWFWRNRTDAPVTLTLRTRGEYTAVKRP
ncbi:hypothetical protein [Brevirhabdus sp.]|uniref:hypothetical protein n=1 Tax=Brevirhabdus sp. TaxID=2004514 RepID=UPI004058EF0D